MLFSGTVFLGAIVVPVSYESTKKTHTKQEQETKGRTKTGGGFVQVLTPSLISFQGVVNSLGVVACYSDYSSIHSSDCSSYSDCLSILEGSKVSVQN